MKRRKKRTTKCQSNRQKVKAQAKELKRLRHECTTDRVRINYLRATVLEKQQLINEQARTIESLKAEMRRLEVELMTKKPFWKRVLG